MWPHNAIKKALLLQGFIGSIYLPNLSRGFPQFSDAIGKTTPVWKYDKKAVSDPTPGVTSFSTGIQHWLMAQTSVHPSSLRVSGCCKKLFPEGKTSTFWLKLRTAHCLKERSSLPPAGFTSAPKRCETPTLGTAAAGQATESQTYNLAPKLAA